MAQPSQNGLLPEAFDLKETPADVTSIAVADNVTFWLKGSENFDGLPKGFTRLQLSTDKALNSVENFVYLSLWESLYDLKQTRLATEASIAGMSLSMSASNGISLTMSGFTDKQPELLARALEGLRVNPSELEFGQAIERYLRRIENSKRAFPYTRFTPLLGMLTREGRYTDASLALAASKANLEEFTQFVEAVLTTSHLRAFFFGNYDEADVRAAYTQLEDYVTPSRSAGYARAGIYNQSPVQR